VQGSAQGGESFLFLVERRTRDGDDRIARQSIVHLTRAFGFVVYFLIERLEAPKRGDEVHCYHRLYSTQEWRSSKPMRLYGLWDLGWMLLPVLRLRPAHTPLPLVPATLAHRAKPCSHLKSCVQKVESPLTPRADCGIMRAVLWVKMG